MNLRTAESYRIQSSELFKGNIDLDKLEQELRGQRSQISFVLMTVTSNNDGGQPMSMANLKRALDLTHSYGLPLFLDTTRFAKNAFFIKQREPDYGHRTVADIAREMFSYLDGCTMSAKKDGLVLPTNSTSKTELDRWRTFARYVPSREDSIANLAVGTRFSLNLLPDFYCLTSTARLLLPDRRSGELLGVGR